MIDRTFNLSPTTFKHTKLIHQHYKTNHLPWWGPSQNLEVKSSIISPWELQLLSKLILRNNLYFNQKWILTHRFSTKVFFSNFILLLLTKILNAFLTQPIWALYGCMCTSGLTHTHTHTQRTHNGTNQITLNKFQPLGIYSPPTSHGVMGLHTSSAAT